MEFCLAHRCAGQMPYEEISKIVVRRVCCGASVYVIAAADETPHMIQGLEDPDGFVKLVTRMMEEQQQQGNAAP
ncbi:hypothetical protein ACA910_017468 [Epithemia clementina (nom. ined.)]